MANSVPDPESESMSVQARIARMLVSLADPRFPSILQIPAYARRHLPEHAAAGGNLNERTVPVGLLPYLDITRLREVASSADLPLMPLVRKASHAWRWEHPGQNAAALRYFAAAERFPIPEAALLTPWSVSWAKSPGASEILARIDSVVCVDAAALDDRIVVVTGTQDGRVDLWDLASGQSLQFPRQPAGVNAVTIVPKADGDLLMGTGGDGGVVRCWLVQRATGRPTTWHGVQPIRSFDVGDAVTALSSARLLDESYILAGRTDGQVSLLDSASGDRQDQLIHEGEVTGIATVRLADGTPALVSVGVDATLQVSSLRDRLVAVNPGFRADEAIRAVVALIRSDGRALAVTAGDRGSVRIWDLPPGPCSSRDVPGFEENVTALTAEVETQGMLVVSGDSQGCLRIVDAKEARIVGEAIEAHRERVVGLAFARSRNRRPIVISGGGDEVIRRWDLGDAMLEGSRGSGQSAVADDSPGIINIQDPSVRVWRLDDGRELGQEMGAHTHRMVAVATGHLAAGTAVAVTDEGRSSAIASLRTLAVSTAELPDGRLIAVSASTDGYLRVWDLTDADDNVRFLSSRRPMFHRDVRCVVTAVRMDNRVVVVSAGRDRNLRIWDLDSATVIGDELAGHDRPVTALAVAATSGRPAVIVSGGEDTTLRTWAVDTGSPTGPPIRGHQSHITALAAAYLDGTVTAVTGCAWDGAVRAWKLSGENPQPQLLTEHDGGVTAVAISTGHGKHPCVVTAGEDRTIRVWDLDMAAPLVDPMPVPGTVRAINCFEGARPGAVIAGDDVLAVVHW